MKNKEKYDEKNKRKRLLIVSILCLFIFYISFGTKVEANSNLNDESINTSSNFNNVNKKTTMMNTFDIASLSKDKDTLDSFNFDFTTEVYGTRIKVTTNTVTST